MRQYVNKEINNIDVVVDGVKISLDSDFFEIKPVLNLDFNESNQLINTENDLTIIIDTTFDEENKNLFVVKKFVSFVQNMRKEANLRPWDKIKLFIGTSSKDAKESIELLMIII